MQPGLLLNCLRQSTGMHSGWVIHRCWQLSHRPSDIYSVLTVKHFPGTGGGFPGIPLAILFPETHFLLIDGTRKKITVVNEICDAVAINNVRAKQLRIEEHRQKHDFIVTRAVAKLDKLLMWTSKNIKSKESHAQRNGLLALKGGESIYTEVEEIPRGNYAELYPIAEFFENPFFEEKFVVYVQGE